MATIQDPNGSATLTALHPNAARSATGTGTAFDVRQMAGLGTLILDAAAGTGTSPTMALVVQDSVDGSTGWANVTGAAFAGLTTTASTQRLAVNLGATRGFLRMSWTIGGTTPSYQFSVSMLGRMI
jgi:hypothetical protein